MTNLYRTLLLLALAPLAYADDGGNGTDPEAENREADAEPVALAATDSAAGDASVEEPGAEPSAEPGAPKTLAGMSILGNEEAPKSLVIIPWKASEIGADLGLDDGLDERPNPVDRDVFLRELEFYEIRSGR